MKAKNSVSDQHSHKPLLRGWLHAGAVPGTVAVTGVLCWSTHEDIPRMISMLIYGMSMLMTYTVSAIYHLFNWHSLWNRIWRTFDHSNIFLLIAGTYTPICFNLLKGEVRIIFLCLTWGLAITGILLTIFSSHTSRWLRTGFYIGMGWVSVLAIPAVLEVQPWYSVAVLLLGGLLYTLGAVVYGLRRPNPFPRYFGFHEIFHLFVIAGCTTYVVHMFIWVLPYPRA